eukprot:scaffold179304_cov18-Tisochrysis_lutea.AAC.2
MAHICAASPEAFQGIGAEVPAQQQQLQQSQQQQQQVARGLGGAAPAGSTRGRGTAVAEGVEQGTHGA